MSATLPTMPWLAGATLAALASFAMAEAWRRIAERRQWIDLPDDRRLHQVPTPRGGGIGIAFVLLACAPWLPHPWLFAAGALLTAGGGLYDDLRPLRAPTKLALQALGVLPLALAWPLLPAVFGPVAGTALAWMLALAVVNAWNFMDGSNGLCASQGALVAVAAGLLGAAIPGVACLAVALTAACLGFLPLNLPRARVFLGDVGSYAIGYGVAALALMLAAEATLPSWVLWLPPSAFVLDTGLTLLWRLARRRKVWLAHREHLYQRAIAAGCSHAGVCAAYAAWTVVVAALAIWLVARAPGLAPIAVLAVYSAGILLYVWAGRRWPLPDRTEGVG